MPPQRISRGSSTISLGFPPFTGAVKLLVIINVVVFFVVLLGNIASPGFQGEISRLFGFSPIRGLSSLWVWQFITYGFIHIGLSHILFNMLSLWMFGSQLEMDWGRRRFLEFYFFCMVGAALTTVAVAYLGVAVTGTSPSPFWASLAELVYTPTVGASGAVYGILIAFGILHANQELFLFPLPFRIKAKYMVAIIVLVVFATSLQPGRTGVANFAHLGGLLFGFVYVRFLPRRGLGLAFSESYYGVRNQYYRWKRRRAAKKFEVYMRNVDRQQYFDEYGNFRDPGKNKKDGESRPPWVN